MRRLLLIVALALAACGGTPPTCVKPVDSACWFHNTDGNFYKFERNAMGLVVGVQCACAEMSQ